MLWCMGTATTHAKRCIFACRIRRKSWRSSSATKARASTAGKLPDPLAEENLLRQSGRGVLMMQAFMDEFQVTKREPSGTEIRMVKYKAKAD